MSNPLKLVTQSGPQNYDCSGCGGCCRGRFAIIITQADKDRIMGQNWSDDELGYPVRNLFERKGDDFQLAHRSDGSCVFLQDDGLCRIHAKHGEPAKPVACRLYPFTFVPFGNEIRVDLRFDCPSAAANKGGPILNHHAELRELMPQVIPESAATLPVPPLFEGADPLTWSQMSRITQAFERVLTDVSLGLTKRIAACVVLSDILRRSEIVPLNGRKLGDILDAAVAHAQETIANDPFRRVAPSGTDKSVFRQMLGVYGRLDQVGEKAKPLKQLKASVQMLAGKGIVPELRPGFPKVTFADLENSCGVPTATGAAQTLERYLLVHLNAQGFFGRSFYNRTYLDGMNSLLLAYPLICWFMRAYALGDSLSAPNAASVERAIMVIDHHRGINPVLDLPTERMRTKSLCEPETLRSLVIWYGS